MRSKSRVLLWSIAAVVTAVVLYSSALMGTASPPRERSQGAAQDEADQPAAPMHERVEPSPQVVTGGAPSPDAGRAALEEQLAAEPHAPPPVDVLPPTSPDAWKPNAPPPQRGTDLVFSNTGDRGQKKKEESDAPKPATAPSPPPERAVPPSADVLPPTRYDTPETAPKAEPNRDTGLRFSTKPAEADKP